MNNKLLFQDLTDQLSESGKLKKKDTEEFLKAFFKVIEDSLFEGETVKIQGLGTFKLLKVESRKSVNVSTGEEFEIKEHYKISFSPDNTLKEIVNEPFSYLEPVELDGSSAKKEPVVRNIREEKDRFDEMIINAEEKEEEMEKKPDKPKGTPHNMMPQNTDDLRTPNKERKNETQQPTNGSQKKSEKSGGSKNSGSFFRVFLILIVLALAAWAILSNYSAKKENDHKLKEFAVIDADTSFEDTPSEDFETVIQDSLKLEAEIAAKVESLAIAEKNGGGKNLASKPSAIAKPTPVAATKENEAIKPKMTTQGSTGSDRVTFPVFVKLKQGEMLTVLSLKYYGHKAFWVYIYAANMDVIKDPDHIPLGTRIRIPKPDTSIINANDPDCVAKAKALQTKILSRKE
ncbi:MAG: HU family DNA-binding protein [Bacteroidales bacterium]|nr:HU family DNA-binding protein [Bacteroidales bacterium]